MYRVVIEWLHGGTVAYREERRVLQPTEAPEFVVLPRPAEDQHYEGMTGREAVVAVIDQLEGGMDLRVAFTDARGRRSLREPSGRLKRMSRRAKRAERRAGVERSKGVPLSS